MNKKQTIVMWIGIAALIAFAIFYSKHHDVGYGYGVGRGGRYVDTIDIPDYSNLILFLVCTIAIILAAIYTLRTQKDVSSSKKEINKKTPDA